MVRRPDGSERGRNGAATCPAPARRTCRTCDRLGRVAVDGSGSEYEDRFLVELVQNAYDAQPSGASNGAVHIRLDERPDVPVLYVANTGTPFTKANFAALTNVALSSKPAGEGIGNKGLGFRSVLRVCDSPEVYSADSANPPGAKFDGYCFGFATEAEIRALVPDEEAFERVLRDFSRYLLPVPAEAADPYLAELRAQGMVTVVRMPIAETTAVEVAGREIKNLLSPRPPIALFLDRITEITVEHHDADGSQARDVIRRTSQVAAVAAGDLHLRWVTTAGHRFLTASRVVEAAEVREVIEAAVADGQLDPAWADWQADVEVSLAVEPESETDSASGALYTYLPMQVRAPFRGHLHAPFHTKMARLDLNESSIFNEFLLNEAARVAVSAIRALVEGEVDLPLAVRQAAVVDLLCWDQGRLPYLREAMAGLWGSLGTTLRAGHPGGSLHRAPHASPTWPPTRVVDHDYAGAGAPRPTTTPWRVGKWGQIKPSHPSTGRRAEQGGARSSRHGGARSTWRSQSGASNFPRVTQRGNGKGVRTLDPQMYLRTGSEPWFVMWAHSSPAHPVASASAPPRATPLLYVDRRPHRRS